MGFILLSPFAGTSYLRENFLDIKGMKPFLVLGFFVFLISLLNYQKASRMPKYAYYFGLAVILIFTISIFRSLKHLHVFNKYYFDFNINISEYLMSAYIKELLFFMPFVVIIKYANTERDLNRIMDVIYYTIIILSLHILYESIIIVGNIYTMESYWGDIYVMHRNEIAMFYVCGLSFAFRKYFLNKKIIHIIFILIILTSIGYLYSRTGYFTAIFAIVAYLTISKRKKMLTVIFIVFALVCSTILVSTFVLERATLGFKGKDRDVISAGRIDGIWIPLIKENVSDPEKFMFGDGRYAIQASDSVLKGRVGLTSHPHNMYLELLIDAGIISFIIIVSMYYVILRNAFHTLQHTTEAHLKENLYACIVSILCFLIAGMTQYTFFPTNYNIFIWVILGCTVAYFKLSSYKEMSNVKA